MKFLKCCSAALVIFLVIFSAGGSVRPGCISNPSDYVYPFIETDGNGYIFPGAAHPFGLVQLSTDTGGDHGLFLMADGKWRAKRKAAPRSFSRNYLADSPCEESR